jgi:hypothetical protein
LEQTDHLTFSEDVDIRTRVKITVDRKALYEIDLPEKGMEDVLELLMRSYPGIFSFALGVDEKWFSGKLGISVPALRQILYKLSLEHVINYIPADQSSVIQLHHDRLRPGNLALLPKTFEDLHATWQERAEAIIGYASEEDECRSRYLVAYFGQEDGADCGTCDVCRAGRSRSFGKPQDDNNHQGVGKPQDDSAFGKPQDDEGGRSVILSEAKDLETSALKAFVSSKGGRYTLDDLNAFLADPANGLTRHALETLRRLIDDRELPAPM